MRKNVWVKILAVFCLISFFSAWPGFPGNDSVSGEERTETAKAGTEEVKNVRVPGEIPAVAVEVNTDSQGISEKLSEVFYTVYTEDDILRGSGKLGDRIRKYETVWGLYNQGKSEITGRI